MLNERGARDWEALGMLLLANGRIAVLLKKPTSQS
jgi:hypothetical protein